MVTFFDWDPRALFAGKAPFDPHHRRTEELEAGEEEVESSEDNEE